VRDDYTENTREVPLTIYDTSRREIHSSLQIVGVL